jgi:hypothetical protein
MQCLKSGASENSVSLTPFSEWNNDSHVTAFILFEQISTSSENDSWRIGRANSGIEFIRRSVDQDAKIALKTTGGSSAVQQSSSNWIQDQCLIAAWISWDIANGTAQAYFKNQNTGATFSPTWTGLGSPDSGGSQGPRFGGGTNQDNFYFCAVDKAAWPGVLAKQWVDTVDFSLIVEPANQSPYLISVPGGAGGDVEVSCDTGTVTITGTNASIEQQTNVEVSCSIGSVTITGVNATVEQSTTVEVSCGTGAVTVAGVNAVVDQATNIEVACGTGSVVVTGIDATVQQGTTVEVSAGVGSVVVTGTAATVEQQVNVEVDCATGSVVVTGTNAVIDQQVVGETNIICQVGAVTVSGTAATVNQISELALNSGSIVVTGLNASVNAGQTKSLGVGAVVVTGVNADIEAAQGISLATGSVVITGFNIGITGLIWTPINAASTTWTEIDSSSGIWTEIS